MRGLQLDVSIWMVVICILVAVLYAAILYFRNPLTNKPRLNVELFLAILRGALIMGILLMLLNPFLQTTQTNVKNPILTFVVDNSKSVGAWASKNQLSLNQDFDEMYEQLSDHFDIHFYTLGENINAKADEDTLSFDDELTDLSALVSLTEQYEGENLTGIVLATDGIYNKGKSPLYSNLPLDLPIYSVALGDTSKKKDISIARIYHNRIAYLNDIAGFEVDIKGVNCRGNTVNLILEKEINGSFRELTRKSLRIDNDLFFKTVDFSAELNETGINHFRLRLSRINGEEVYENNVKDFFVDVLDSRQKIRILANAPHPDLSTLKNIILSKKNYTVELEYLADSPSPASTSDIVVFHDLPSEKYNINEYLSIINQRKTPRLFILGQSVDLDAFNEIQDILSIESSVNSANMSQAQMSSTFSSFTLSDQFKDRIVSFPPLSVPFGEYNVGANSLVLLYQRIGSIDTDFPLMTFQNYNGLRSAILGGEGIWRWKLYDYFNSKNFELVEELVSKSVTYLSIKDDKRKFRLYSPQRIYSENEDITFSAELYNENLEPITFPDVFLSLEDENKDVSNFTFSKNSDDYSLDLGRWSSGKYKYSASVQYDGQTYSDAGSLIIKEVQYELYNLEADHSLLYSISQQQGGGVYSLHQAQELVEDIRSNKNVKPVMYQHSQNSPLIELKWIFFLFLSLLTLEWGIRRYQGTI